jgi:hypothetical protein
MWRFMWYKKLGGASAWSDWYEAQDGSVRARHDVVFDTLESRAAHEWTPPFAKLMGKGLVEILIHKNVQHRLLGCFGPEQGQFSIVVTCTHKDKVYYPKEAKDTHKKS